LWFVGARVVDAIVFSAQTSRWFAGGVFGM
jgi:hypothetical protein